MHCRRILTRKSITAIEFRGRVLFFTHSSKVDLSLWCICHKIFCQRIHSCFLFISISFKVKVTLFALAVIQHGVSAIVLSLSSLEIDTLSTQTTLHSQVLMLSLDQIDNITAQKHLCFSITVLEKLLLRDFKLVAKQIYLNFLKKWIRNARINNHSLLTNA